MREARANQSNYWEECLILFRGIRKLGERKIILLFTSQSQTLTWVSDEWASQSVSQWVLSLFSTKSQIRKIKYTQSSQNYQTKIYNNTYYYYYYYYKWNYRLFPLHHSLLLLHLSSTPDVLSKYVHDSGRSNVKKTHASANERKLVFEKTTYLDPVTVVWSFDLRGIATALTVWVTVVVGAMEGSYVLYQPCGGLGW